MKKAKIQPLTIFMMIKTALSILLFAPVTTFADVCVTKESPPRFLEIYEIDKERKIRLANDSAFQNIVFDDYVDHARQLILPEGLKMSYTTSMRTEVTTLYPPLANPRDGLSTVGTGILFKGRAIEMTCTNNDINL